MKGETFVLILMGLGAFTILADIIIDVILFLINMRAKYIRRKNKKFIEEYERENHIGKQY